MKISFNPRSTSESEAEALLQDLAEQAKAKEEPMRLRLQPQLYHPTTNSYRSWRLLAWTLEMESLDELLAFRGSLTQFITFLERYGPVATEKWFADAMKSMDAPDQEASPDA